MGHGDHFSNDQDFHNARLQVGEIKGDLSTKKVEPKLRVVLAKIITSKSHV